MTPRCRATCAAVTWRLVAAGHDPQGEQVLLGGAGQVAAGRGARASTSGYGTGRPIGRAGRRAIATDDARRPRRPRAATPRNAGPGRDGLRCRHWRSTSRVAGTATARLASGRDDRRSRATTRQRASRTTSTSAWTDQRQRELDGVAGRREPAAARDLADDPADAEPIGGQPMSARATRQPNAAGPLDRVRARTGVDRRGPGRGGRRDAAARAGGRARPRRSMAAGSSGRAGPALAAGPTASSARRRSAPAGVRPASDAVGGRRHGSTRRPESHVSACVGSRRPRAPARSAARRRRSVPAWPRAAPGPGTRARACAGSAYSFGLIVQYVPLVVPYQRRRRPSPARTARVGVVVRGGAEASPCFGDRVGAAGRAAPSGAAGGVRPGRASASRRAAAAPAGPSARPAARPCRGSEPARAGAPARRTARRVGVAAIGVGRPRLAAGRRRCRACRRGAQRIGRRAARRRPGSRGSAAGPSRRRRPGGTPWPAGGRRA